MTQAARYITNQGLFTNTYLEKVLGDPNVPERRMPPTDADQRLTDLLRLWESVRSRFVKIVDTEVAKSSKRYSGLPENLIPLDNTSESDVENDFVKRLLSDVLTYHIHQNKTLLLQGTAADETHNSRGANRPDLILYRTKEAYDVAAQVAQRSKSAPNAVDFCREAQFICDAKKFWKGICADETDSEGARKNKRDRDENGALEDRHQVERYLRGSDRKWGILTNGRTWLLIANGKKDAYLQFDLVLWLEDLRLRKPADCYSDADRDIFCLFWYIFGPPAVEYLAKLESEAQANVREVRLVLRENVHEAVGEIASGYLFNPANRFSLPPTPETLDHLRELSLTFLYRLLFVLKAEAQNLLPMKNELGVETGYANQLSTRAIFAHLKQTPESERQKFGTIYRRELRDLFSAVDKGSAQHGVPAFNGGLFDPERNQELEKLEMLDSNLYRVFVLLIYQRSEMQPVPYADLDVRDLGDIYEGLIEQRLVYQSESQKLALRGEKTGKKSSGSYFTPDSLVDFVTRRVLEPRLNGCGQDPAKVLALRVLDPAMGSGHFLVKAVDVISEYLTKQCDPQDPGAPCDNGESERAYWRSLVVENCIYGVDVNPMAVELAKVALWLHCARGDKPLSFLDHHLKTGNSLVGASLDRLSEPGLRFKKTKKGGEWVAVPKKGPQPLPEPAAGDKSRASKKPRKNKDHENQLVLFPIDTDLFAGILESVRSILKAASDSPDAVRRKRLEYARQVEDRLAAHRLLADLWCAQWFFAEGDVGALEVYERASEQPSLYDRVKQVCGERNDEKRRAELSAIVEHHPFVEKVRRMRSVGFGNRPFAFFHWQLEFPEVAFDQSGQLRDGFGFDAVIGNPPWDKIKPAKRDFFTPFDPAIADSQGAGLDRRVMALVERQPALQDQWNWYEKTLNDTVYFLSASGTYQWQCVEVEGRKTGGDPDLFRYFVERAWQAAGSDGRLGLVVPATIWQGEGCTGLRRLLFENTSFDALFVFENYRKWAFDIDSRFKFTAFATRKTKPVSNSEFSAGFMLRNPRILEGRAKERVILLSLEKIRLLSPETLALLDFKSGADFDMISRLYQKHPTLGSEKSGWGVKYRCELHMTNDSWLFKSPDWMRKRGFTLVKPVRNSDGTWTQIVEKTNDAIRLPQNLPPGGEYWVAANAEFYEARGYEQMEADLPDGKRICYIHPEDRAEAKKGGFRWKVPAEWHFRILPNGIYTALYEGRMVGNFDHAKKRYVKGEGRKAIWEELKCEEKRLISRVYAQTSDTQEVKMKVGFCDITGATNERTMLATLLPPRCNCGHKVPVLQSLDSNPIRFAAFLNSICLDSLMRLLVTTNLTWNFVSSVVVPALSSVSESCMTRLNVLTVKLTCTTPEMSLYWNRVFPNQPWSYESAERDLRKRGEIRAELDAIVADLYGLSVEEYARILTGFPLLDRDQPPLPGDYFLTEADEGISNTTPGRGEKWVEVDGEFFEIKPRSFITRDTALLAYMKRKKYPIPEDLEAWYRDKVQLDPNGPLSRFRIGTVRDLEARVLQAQKLGAVPYIPTGSSDNADEAVDSETEQ